MITLFLFAAPVPALATEPDAAAVADPKDARRYRNRFGGVGMARDGESLGLHVRLHGVSAPDGGGVFARGGDLEATVSPSGEHSLRVRSLFGLNLVPGDRLRIAAYTGVGLVPHVPSIVGLAGGDGLPSDAPLADVVVPVMGEVGVAIGDEVGVHLRGGLNLVPLSVAMQGGELGFPKRQAVPEGVVSASFGSRRGARVPGFRIEAGRIGTAWSLVVGIGG